ncbi:hypothetical protein CFIICLFH_0752 [Methylobacterium goesingense]|nr:hypothetical protein CFIICLFH_0752 [Methylobacterium goesingense]
MQHVVHVSDLDGAVDAFLANPKASVLMVSEARTVDVGAVVRADDYASRALASLNASEAHRRMAVRTAILLAKPVHP